MNKTVVSPHFFQIHMFGGNEVLNFPADLTCEFLRIECLDTAYSVLSIKKTLKKGIYV